MANLNIEISHELGQKEALKRIKGISALLKSHYADKISDLAERWGNNHGRIEFKAMGHFISLTVNVEEATANLSADLPFAAVFFKGRIESAVKEKLTFLLRSNVNRKSDEKATNPPTRDKQGFVENMITVAVALAVAGVISEIFCGKKISHRKAKDAVRVIYGI